MSKPELTAKEKATVRALGFQVSAIRGVQVFMLALGVYVAIFESRGWPAFLICAALACWMQLHAMPVLPDWLESRRPGE